MSFESLMDVTQRLSASMEALTAVGAELRLRRDGASADPRIRDLLQEVVRRIDPNLFDDVSPEQRAIALAALRVGFHHAVDLLDDPARAPGWLHEDPTVLQTIGQRSRRVVHQINAFAAVRPRLKETIECGGTLLDIGTGFGWLAIEAARTWPTTNIVGIDIWEPALALAGSNVAAAAMANAFEALEPGGWLVFGLFPPPPDPLGEVLTARRIVRCGGHPWTKSEVEERLPGLGFAEVETYCPGSLSWLAFGRKPS